MMIQQPVSVLNLIKATTVKRKDVVLNVMIMGVSAQTMEVAIAQKIGQEMCVKLNNA